MDCLTHVHIRKLSISLRKKLRKPANENSKKYQRISIVVAATDDLESAETAFRGIRQPRLGMWGQIMNSTNVACRGSPLISRQRLFLLPSFSERGTARLTPRLPCVCNELWLIEMQWNEDQGITPVAPG